MTTTATATTTTTATATAAMHRQASYVMATVSPQPCLQPLSSVCARLHCYLIWYCIVVYVQMRCCSVQKSVPSMLSHAAFHVKLHVTLVAFAIWYPFLPQSDAINLLHPTRKESNPVTRGGCRAPAEAPQAAVG